MADNEDFDGFEQKLSRYVVGIDLGTTNCAVAYIDTLGTSRDIRSFPIEQWVDFGTRERRDLLPSFLYQPLESETASLTTARETVNTIAGSLARDRGLQLPGRQISSAKSWLCHAGVDRREAILPWHGDVGVEKLSPVDASSRLLAHIRQAWDRAFKGQPLAEQDIVLTLPASFDQVARQLTIEAAAMAGLHRILPIEEPQAAFYAWLARHRDTWEEQVQPGQTILVCDIGGGTTDFTLIRVRRVHDGVDDTPAQPTETLDQGDRQRFSLHRVAVGQHLILGGDNIDLALAKTAERKLTGGKSLPPRSWDALRQACRVAKETLLGEAPPSSYTVHLPGSGARLVGGGQQVQITGDEVTHCVLDGFIPMCSLEARPEAQQVGFQEFGLPFATDAAITKHLAKFLWEHRRDGRTDSELAELSDPAQAKPDWILFNGGVMTSSQLRQRIHQVVGSWFSESADAWRAGDLDGERLDLAVAIGATYFGQVRRGEGVRIEAKLACSYYIQTGIDPPTAICIVPGSASPGDRFRLSDSPVELTIGQPVQFPVAYSSTRLADRIGDVVEMSDEEFASLPPIRTVIEPSGARRKGSLPVFLEVELSQIGTLQIYCHATKGAQRWKLEFDVRGSTQTDLTARDASANTLGVLDEEVADRARKIVAQVFHAAQLEKPSQLIRLLSEELGMKRSQWRPNLLRSLWADLIEYGEGRRKSAAHEARWLNLLGYCLRPGYGMAADDWRVAQTWRCVQGKLAFSTASSRNESLILWRRIAGGFTSGQQLTVYQQIAGPLRSVLDPAKRARGGSGVVAAELIELLRLVGSLELLPAAEKVQLGSWLLELLPVRKWEGCQGAILWAVGRLGSRVPAYGPLNCVVETQQVTAWLRRLLEQPLDDANYALALMLCARKVHDRYRDIPDEFRARVASQLQHLAAPPHYYLLVSEGGQLESDEATQILGEALPLGLQLPPTI